LKTGSNEGGPGPN